MNIFRKAAKYAGEWLARNGYYRMAASAGYGSKSISGLTVNEATALCNSVVWACTRVISESAASVSLQLFRRTDQGREKAGNHPLYPILHDQPNEYMDAMTFREAMTAKALLWGNAYALKVYRSDESGNIIALWPIHPSMVTVDWTIKTRKLIYKVSSATGEQMEVQPRDMFHLRGLSDDGIVGYSVLDKAKESIGLSMTLERYGAKFFEKGGRVPGVLKYPGAFKSQEARDAFEKRWADVYGGENNWNSSLILENGMDWAAMGQKLVDAQFVEVRQWMIAEVCRWFGMKPHMVGDLSRATFGNIEQQSLEFVIYTLRPWLVRWEQAINRQLIRPSDRATYYAEHNIDALLRGDFASRTTGYATALQNGYMSINDVRRLENLNPIPGGDAYHIQLNMQTVSGEPTAAELAQMTKPEPAPQQKQAEVRETPITVTVDARQEAKRVTKTILRNQAGRITGVIEDGE